MNLVLPAILALIPPHLEYRFDDAGSEAASTGTAPIPLRLQRSDGAAADLRGPDGSGVSGKRGDRALALPADRMGRGDRREQNAGGIAQHDGNDVLPEVLVSFTMQGWFRTAPGTTIGGFARLIDHHDDRIPGEGGYEIYGGRRDPATNAPTLPGHLTIEVNDWEVTTRTPAFDAQDQWTFFAAVFDGVKGQATFYHGSRQQPVRVVDVFSVPVGAVRPDRTRFAVGNRDRSPRLEGERRDRPFLGLIDNVRLFVGEGDVSGALDEARLERLRLLDIENAAPPVQGKEP